MEADGLEFLVELLELGLLWCGSFKGLVGVGVGGGVGCGRAVYAEAGNGVNAEVWVGVQERRREIHEMEERKITHSNTIFDT
mmetsp:Transcript_11473/g.16940  ORF Transcript_11473/g.16940 Transcript_11473/m.16940 type:complete len:82 (+) Transcript_11473:93-338(+)